MNWNRKNLEIGFMKKTFYEKSKKTFITFNYTDGSKFYLKFTEEEYKQFKNLICSNDKF